jgi:hypothetical protein
MIPRTYKIAEAPQITSKSRCLLLLAEGVGEPVETLVQTIAGWSGSTLNVPLAVTELVEAKALSHFLNFHCVGEILLVGEHEKNSIAKLILCKHAAKLIFGTVLVALLVVDTVAIVTINHEDGTLGVLVVVAPERANLVLPSNVPHSERDVLVFYCLDVETDGGDGGDNLAQLQLVQDGGLTYHMQ